MDKRFETYFCLYTVGQYEQKWIVNLAPYDEP